MSELKRRWRVFFRWWCGGLWYWLLYPHEINGHHRWVNEEGMCKRTCSRCGRHERLMSKTYPRIGEARDFWSPMNWDELRQL